MNRGIRNNNTKRKPEKSEESRAAGAQITEKDVVRRKPG